MSVDLILSGNPSFDVDAYVMRTGDGLGGAVLGFFDRLNNTSVNEAARNFRTAVEKMEKYDAHRATHYWDQASWAITEHNALANRRLGIYAASTPRSPRTPPTTLLVIDCAAGASGFHVEAVLNPIDAAERQAARIHVSNALQPRPVTSPGRTEHKNVYGPTHVSSGTISRARD